MIRRIIDRLYQQNDESWSGYLYRAGDSGIFYHTDVSGAEYYQKGGVQVYECPAISNALLLDVDSDNNKPANEDGILTAGLGFIAKLNKIPIDDLYDSDWVIQMEDALPKIFSKFDAIVIFGETGSEVWGFPVEVVLKSPIQPTSDPRAIATLVN